MPDPGDNVLRLAEHGVRGISVPNEPLTQDYVALRFAELHGGKLVYDHHHGAWFAWTGSHWKREETGLAFELARRLARAMAESGDAKIRRAVERTEFAGGVERFCRSDRTFAVTSEDWDRDAFLLGTPNGTVDLPTGRVRPADPDDRITRTTAIAPDPGRSCERWLAFLDETTGGDSGIVRFLQQWCGYALTGDTREHALVFVYGPGGNGKSVFLNTITGIMGDYAAVAAMDTFTASQADRHPTDLAMLRGARLVTASETEEGRAWAESRIKQMTGGDPITARFMRQDFFTYLPRFKLMIIGNHKSVLHDVDDAARRRFNIVPFVLKPAKPDRELEAKLKAEWPAILRWMIDGCLDWQACGLARPETVRAATDAYFSEQDLFGQWLEEECDLEPGNPHKWETSGKLFEAWSSYAIRAGEKPGGRKAFCDSMQRRGFEPYKAPRGIRAFRGIRLSEAGVACGAFSGLIAPRVRARGTSYGKTRHLAPHATRHTNVCRPPGRHRSGIGNGSL
ncbi:phage/plasmid primase, P4 family [Faunimonas sp. B44]|uniref:phage/plasmid primase, P4 family n=1 Tax=Faunimonas sp. B44 TaxID=3461493 RepID=UPI004044CF8F